MQQTRKIAHISQFGPYTKVLSNKCNIRSYKADQHNFDKAFKRRSLDKFGFILSVESELYPLENPDPDLLCLIMLLTLKAPITTAADDKFCDIFANSKKK